MLDAIGEHPHVAEIRGRGLLQAIELVRDRETLEPFAAAKKVTGTIVAAGLANGAFFYPGGAGGAQDVICLGPPLTVSEDEIDSIVNILTKSINDAVAHVEAGA